MSLRYELDPKYLFQFQKTFTLKAQTIINRRVTITFEDLNFPHLKHKTITQFTIMILKKNRDILQFETLTEDWSYQLDIEEDTTIQIHIEFFWKRHKDKIHIMDWEEFLLEKR